MSPCYCFTLHYILTLKILYIFLTFNITQNCLALQLAALPILQLWEVTCPPYQLAQEIKTYKNSVSTNCRMLIAIYINIWLRNTRA